MNSEFEILLLQIFSDAASMGNGMSAGAPSCTMFYFNFQNLDPKFNARLANIHLIAICNSKHLKEDDGYEQLMGYIVEEIKKNGNYWIFT